MRWSKRKEKKRERRNRRGSKKRDAETSEGMQRAPRGSEKRKRKEVLRIAEGCRECQVTKRRREHKRRDGDGEMRKSR